MLGAVLGFFPVDADANYGATMADATIIGPDFTKTMIEDALVMALGEIVEAIASTPLNPERAGFTTQTAPLAYNDLIPRVDSAANKVIGVIGEVRDETDDTPLLHVPMDSIRTWKIFASNVYSDFTPYLYAINGNRILHTRTNVIIDVCTFARPTSFATDVPLDDWHEGGLVAGAVSKLALKENQFPDLFAGQVAIWQQHLAQIRSYGSQEIYGNAQSAPSKT